MKQLCPFPMALLHAFNPWLGGALAGTVVVVMDCIIIAKSVHYLLNVNIYLNLPSHKKFTISYNILLLTQFREMLWTRTPLNWREVEGCESHEWKELHTRTRPNSSITHQK